METIPTRTYLDLRIDLQRGVVPISKAASSLAALIKRANSTGQPVIVTQKGYPTGVLLPIELFDALKRLTEDQDVAMSQGGDEITARSANVTPPIVVEDAPQEAAAPRVRRRKRTKATPGTPPA